jgi:hypothetical protein
MTGSGTTESRTWHCTFWQTSVFEIDGGQKSNARNVQRDDACRKFQERGLESENGTKEALKAVVNL